MYAFRYISMFISRLVTIEYDLTSSDHTVYVSMTKIKFFIRHYYLSDIISSNNVVTFVI